MKIQENEEMVKIQQELVKKNLPPTTFTRKTQTVVAGENADVKAKNEHIREMEARLRDVSQDNHLLRAQVDESNHWVYERGPVAEELEELRASSVDQTREINRLTRENNRLRDENRRAGLGSSGIRPRQPAHLIGHPEMERATITQNAVNNLFDRARRSTVNQYQPQQ